MKIPAGNYQHKKEGQQRTTRIVVIFFLLLFLGLFLGDGKQTTIEVFGVSIAIVLWIVALYDKEKQKKLPTALGAPWVALCGVAIVSSVTSASVGFSVSWLVTFACWYLVYRLFYTVASEQSIKQFVTGLLVFVGAASFLFVGSYVVTQFQMHLPSMNLIALNYGHSHFADLLVFVAPSVFFVVLQPNVRKTHRISMVLFVVLLLLTFSRGAVLVVGSYIMSLLLFSSFRGKVLRLIAFSSAATLLIVALVWVGGQRIDRSLIRTFQERIQRPLSTGSRLEYWQQAIEGLKEKPFFGSGPGTFFLVSTRLQKGSGESSWYAHSQPLQMGAELGIIGLVAYLWLIGSHVVLFFHTKSTLLLRQSYAPAVLFGVILLFIYGLFEFVFDFSIMSLLFWAGVGLLTGLAQSEPTEMDGPPKSAMIVTALVAAFYILWVVSLLLTIEMKRYDMAFSVAPFDTTNALVMLEAPSGRALTNQTVQVALFFHKDNPEVLIALANALQKHDPQHSRKFFQQAIADDPQNMQYFADYLHTLTAADDKKAIASILTSSSGDNINFFDQELIPFLTQDIFQYLNGSEKKDEYFAKLYYLLGLAVLDKHPDKTRELWTIARNRAPQWGHFHVELATLYAQYFSDKEARNILAECLMYESARTQCSNAIKYGTPSLGSLAPRVRSIPSIY